MSLMNEESGLQANCPPRVPQVLAVAATINGEDFCRFNEGLSIKLPGVGLAIGGAVIWTPSLHFISGNPYTIQ